MRPIEAELLANGALYREVVQRRLAGARESVWIATANVKAMFVDTGTGFRSVLDLFDELRERRVELRLLHAELPSRPFRAAFEQKAKLVSGGLSLKICPRVHFKTVLVDGAWAYLGSANLTGPASARRATASGISSWASAPRTSRSSTASPPCSSRFGAARNAVRANSATCAPIRSRPRDRPADPEASASAALAVCARDGGTSGCFIALLPRILNGRMGARTGSADLPLHGGRVPAWLAHRMARLGTVIVEALVLHEGPHGVLRRLAHPFWFQALGCVLGMDWHSSGITTSVLGALKRGLLGREEELGLTVCGGRGRHSRKTPGELIALGDRTGLDGASLARTSRLVAKVDSAAVQDGFSLYLHGFVVARDGSWAVIQQGMKPEARTARRYHWLSETVRSFVEEPHAAIEGEPQDRS